MRTAFYIFVLGICFSAASGITLFSAEYYSCGQEGCLFASEVQR